MTRNILFQITGIHSEASEGEDSNEAVEVYTPAQYFFRGGWHYVLYQESVEGSEQVIQNRIKFKDSVVEMQKKGEINTCMIFQVEKPYVTQYQTQYGSMEMEIVTERICLIETENEMRVALEYALFAGDDPIGERKLELRLFSDEVSEKC